MLRLQFFSVIFDVIQKKSIPNKALDNLLRKLDLTENGDNLFCGLLMLIQAILRLPSDAVKENDLKQSLKELKFSDECCTRFISVFLESKPDLYSSKSKFGTPYYHKLKNFNWRIDITLSSNFLSKSLDTVIIFQVNLENGENETFEVSIAKFQQLRFYVASMLKEIQYIEKKNVFKT